MPLVHQLLFVPHVTRKNEKIHMRTPLGTGLPLLVDYCEKNMVDFL